MEVDEQISSGSEGSSSDSESESCEPITLTASSPKQRALPPTSQLNSPLAILSHFVRCVFDAWTGYQIAISRKCGGPETSEKNEWLCEEIIKLLVKSNNLEVDDLVEWLSDILNEEFNLILEDNSVDTAAKAFLHVARTVRERFVTKGPQKAQISTPPTSNLPPIAKTSKVEAPPNPIVPAANAQPNVQKSEHESVLESLQGFVGSLKF